MVELLMVVAIIAVVAALLVAGVSRVMQVQARTETQSDITQMTQALNAAKTAYGHIECVPSQLILFNNMANYSSPPALGTTPDEKAINAGIIKRTANVLRYMFGKRLLSPDQAGTYAVVGWIPGGSTGVVKLTGPEVLVFYLGGMPNISGGNSCLGFSK
ncbi:MAG: hypothetical protein ACKO23_05170, partial [Gemmataceae bacterium]